MAGRILYITDKFKVSQGYEAAFTRMLNKAGIKRHEVITTDIYNLVESPLKKRANESTWKADPAKLPQIERAFQQRISAIRPTLIVVSCPAVLAVLARGDLRLATLEKMRGGVYEYQGITCIVCYPVTAIHRNVDERIVKNEDGEEDSQQPYRVKSGAQILGWDWRKVGRFHAGKPRRLPPFSYSICRTLDDCFAAREFLRNCRLISIDIETGNWPPQITCVGYTGLHADGRVHSYVIPFYDEFAEGGTFWDSVDDHAVAWSVVRDINDTPVLKTMQNGAYDSSYFIRDGAPVANYLLDSMILWWSLYMELNKSLDFISSVLLDNYQYWKDDIKGEADESIGGKEKSMERYWRYNALDCYNTLFNTLYLVQLLQSNKAMQYNFNDAMMRMFSGLRMSMRGMKADKQRREWHRMNLTEDAKKGEENIRYILDDPDFNINSPAQKCSLLYDFMGLRERNAKGRYVDMSKPLKAPNTPSAGAIPLKLAKSEHPLFKYIIEQLESAMVPAKQISNVCNMKIHTDRFRTSHNAVGTETTRFSAKTSNFWDGGNSQNIRKTYRDWIVADDNHLILDIDYSQSDDVFVAYESQDPDKIDVVVSGKDAHAVNGELFFGKSYDSIVAGKKADDPVIVHPIYGIRQLSKRIVHGTNFQMAALTLYITMGRESVVAAAQLLGFADAGSWDQDRLVQLCGKLMAKYRSKYKRLTSKEWYADIARELETTGQMVNAFGITRQFLGDPKDNGTQREATAFIGQSDTAGNMNRVMYEVDWGWMPQKFRDGPNPDWGDQPRKMTYESDGFGFHLQVHDNFVAQLNTQHRRWKHSAHNLLHVMERPIIIKGRTVRIKAEAELGLRWGKGTLPWDGDVEKLDLIHAQLKGKAAKESWQDEEKFQAFLAARKAEQFAHSKRN